MSEDTTTKPARGATNKPTSTANTTVPKEPTSSALNELPSQPAPKSNTVQVDRDQLAKILQDNEEFRMKLNNLESNAASRTPQSPILMRNQNKEMLIPVRKWQDKYVIGWENKGRTEKPVYVYSEYNAQTRESTEYINILLEGEENKPIKVAYVDFFRESEKVFLKLDKKIVEENEVIVQGMARKKDFVSSGFGMYETNVQVPIEVVIPHNSYSLFKEDGKTLVIKDTFIG